MKKFFPLLHWLFTVITGPLLVFFLSFILYAPYNNSFFESNEQLISALFLYIYFGAYVSVPVLAGYYVVCWALCKYTRLSEAGLKTLLNILLLVCVYLELNALTGKNMTTLNPVLPISYACSIILGSLFFALRKKKKMPEAPSVEATIPGTEN